MRSSPLLSPKDRSAFLSAVAYNPNLLDKNEEPLKKIYKETCLKMIEEVGVSQSLYAACKSGNHPLLAHLLSPKKIYNDSETLDQALTELAAHDDLEGMHMLLNSERRRELSPHAFWKALGQASPLAISYLLDPANDICPLGDDRSFSTLLSKVFTKPNSSFADQDWPVEQKQEILKAIFNSPHRAWIGEQDGVLTWVFASKELYQKVDENIELFTPAFEKLKASVSLLRTLERAVEYSCFKMVEKIIEIGPINHLIKTRSEGLFVRSPIRNLYFIDTKTLQEWVEKCAQEGHQELADRINGIISERNLCPNRVRHLVQAIIYYLSW